MWTFDRINNVFLCVINRECKEHTNKVKTQPMIFILNKTKLQKLLIVLNNWLLWWTSKISEKLQTGSQISQQHTQHGSSNKIISTLIFLK